MALIKIEISDLLKKESESILLSQGITPQEAIQTLYKKIVAKGEFPKEVQLTLEKHRPFLISGLSFQISKEQPKLSLI